jgi:hypothetical protein
MTTKIINAKKWRENMSSIWKESKGKNVEYIVMLHSKPMFKVTPLHQEELTIGKESNEEWGEWTNEDIMQAAEGSFSFWKSDKDDNIFDESVSL